MESSDFPTPPEHVRALPCNLSHDATCKYAHINRRRRLLDLPSLIESIEVCCGACCYKHSGNLHKYVTF